MSCAYYCTGLHYCFYFSCSWIDSFGRDFYPKQNINEAKYKHWPELRKVYGLIHEPNSSFLGFKLTKNKARVKYLVISSSSFFFYWAKRPQSCLLPLFWLTRPRIVNLRVKVQLDKISVRSKWGIFVLHLSKLAFLLGKFHSYLVI